MTQKQFKEDLLRGRGCCFQAVKIEPEKFYKEVLWACRNELAFDAQCEGTRAWFLYQMISCYENRDAFLNTTIRAFDSAKVRWRLETIIPCRTPKLFCMRRRGFWQSRPYGENMRKYILIFWQADDAPERLLL